MRCEKVQKLLDAYADGELTETETKLVTTHLQNCHKCRQQLHEVQKLRWLLNDAFADFQPSPSHTLKQRIERVVSSKLPVGGQVSIHRSSAIFALATLVLVWFAVTFLYHQPSHMEHRELIGVKEVAKPENLSVQPSQKPEQRTEKFVGKSIQQPTAKRERTLAKATAKSLGRKTKKLVRIVSSPHPQRSKPEKIRQAVTDEPKAETALEFLAQPRVLLIQVERIVPVNPEEPVPEMFIYRAIDAPFGQGVAMSLPHGAIAQPIAVAEISTSGVQIEHNF